MLIPGCIYAMLQYTLWARKAAAAAEGQKRGHLHAIQSRAAVAAAAAVVAGGGGGNAAASMLPLPAAGSSTRIVVC